MSAKRGRIVRLAAIAALGLALSACGADAGSTSGTAAAAESPAPGSPRAQGSAPARGSAPAPGPAPAQGLPAAAGPTQGSAPVQVPAPVQDPAPVQNPAPAPGTSGTGADPPVASAGTITVNWTPPTENTDGTTLENLAGYKIHYGTASQQYTQTITVSNPGLATYVISSLPPGAYYLSVTAYNSSGTEGPYSSEVSAKVN